MQDIYVNLMSRFHFPLFHFALVCVNVVQRALGNYYVYEAAFDEIITIWGSFLLVEMYIWMRM